MTINKTKTSSNNKVERTFKKHRYGRKKCKLVLAEEINFQINKVHRDSLLEYYLSDDPQHRIDIATQLVSDPSFIKHQTNYFHRHIDTGHLLAVDIDNYAASFNISFARAIAIAKRLYDGKGPDGWVVSPITDVRKRNGEFKYYSHNFEIKAHKHQKIIFQLGNNSISKNDSRQHCRLRFCPNLVRRRHIKKFFKWIFKSFKTEREHAVANSMLLCNDLGIQWQGIAGFALNHDSEAERCEVRPENALANNVPVETVYLMRGAYIGVDTDMLYDPVLKLCNKTLSTTKNANKRVLLENIAIATRYESKWRYQRGDEIYRYDELDKLPHPMERVDFISPEIFSALPERLARQLVIQKTPSIYEHLNREDTKVVVRSVNKHTHTIPQTTVAKLKSAVTKPFVQSIQPARYSK
ncbi:hypothetical protein [Aliiglaciecola lipolytica]|uniref:Uncharacterized protein n=1 Tax=Aliiglaciecola lipolytica E3 TaxID=1127673 RepID=K6XQ00_9ALTE|nr:hypothetical protein [Aliiglaciecola lipolytica]GAC13751.1 hypothetical protein GLIP_1109 [Aliiglaciecola lipolytica E3]